MTSRTLHYFNLTVLGALLTLTFSLFYFSASQDPCISNPLSVTNVKWPNSATGSKELGWTTSTQAIASFDFTYPSTVVFTDTRGCTKTVRK